MKHIKSIELNDAWCPLIFFTGETGGDMSTRARAGEERGIRVEGASIRMAGVADAAGIADIYRPYVTDAVTSFEVEAPSPAEMASGGRLCRGRLEVRRLARRRLVAPSVARAPGHARAAAVSGRGPVPSRLDGGVRGAATQWRREVTGAEIFLVGRGSSTSRPWRGRRQHARVDRSM
jgi:hypothetical protein